MKIVLIDDNNHQSEWDVDDFIALQFPAIRIFSERNNESKCFSLLGYTKKEVENYIEALKEGREDLANELTLDIANSQRIYFSRELAATLLLSSFRSLNLNENLKYLTPVMTKNFIQVASKHSKIFYQQLPNDPKLMMFLLSTQPYGLTLTSHKPGLYQNLNKKIFSKGFSEIKELDLGYFMDEKELKHSSGDPFLQFFSSRVNLKGIDFEKLSLSHIPKERLDLWKLGQLRAKKLRLDIKISTSIYGKFIQAPQNLNELSLEFDVKPRTTKNATEGMRFLASFYSNLNQNFNQIQYLNLTGNLVDLSKLGNLKGLRKLRAYVHSLEGLENFLNLTDLSLISGDAYLRDFHLSNFSNPPSDPFRDNLKLETLSVQLFANIPGIFWVRNLPLLRTLKILIEREREKVKIANLPALREIGICEDNIKLEENTPNLHKLYLGRSFSAIQIKQKDLKILIMEPDFRVKDVLTQESNLPNLEILQIKGVAEFLIPNILFKNLKILEIGSDLSLRDFGNNFPMLETLICRDLSTDDSGIVLKNLKNLHLEYDCVLKGNMEKSRFFPNLEKLSMEKPNIIDFLSLPESIVEINSNLEKGESKALQEKYPGIRLHSYSLFRLKI